MANISQAEQDFLNLANKSEVTLESFQALLRGVERNLPINIRVLNRLHELQDQTKSAIENSLNNRRTLQDWKDFERLTGKGLRIAKRFNNKEFYHFFGVLHATAARYIRGVAD